MSEVVELVRGAHTAFTDAVHALVGLRPDTIDRDDGPEAIIRDSLYTELLDARHGEDQGDTYVRSAPASSIPGWTEALSLIVRIDTRVSVWWPDTPTEPAGKPVTVRRLYALADHPWRPHDVAELRRMTRELEAWVDRARALLPTEITHTYELRAACPACGETTMLVDGGAGEMVRRYVLQATQTAAWCAACETSWGPEQFALLGRLIGAPPVTDTQQDAA
ncbi:DUF7341 domain-containing protein [Nocardia otitidiscaviarum]|uniref:DUF7341 domain-containing protein n=1 Tax=Nocardia otitidiscaviarum TaxID=1823 RepID=UPI002453925B|nr:hypothetical protein [Nocardia otitidiscaviarum]